MYSMIDHIFNDLFESENQVFFPFLSHEKVSLNRTTLGWLYDILKRSQLPLLAAKSDAITFTKCLVARTWHGAVSL
jgi:hypothetical protein